jgi:hypothetical protein
MTIQVAVLNGRGLALASDRHVYRRDDARSSSREAKVQVLGGRVPAALMQAGLLTLMDAPTSRLPIRLERALAAADEGPEALAEAALDALASCVPSPQADHASDDATVIAATLRSLAADAAASKLGFASWAADFCARARETDGFLDRDPEADAAQARRAWSVAGVPGIEISGSREAAEALRSVPQACEAAVVAALSRAVRSTPDSSFVVGACCPSTGVPVLVAVDAWPGLGNRFLLRSRLAGRFKAAWRTGATSILAQGSGRETVNAMLDGIDEENFCVLDKSQRTAQRQVVEARWGRAHLSVSLSSERELATVASGLVRAAEVMGYLVGSREGTVDAVDCVLLTPYGVERQESVAFAPDRREAA